MEALLGLIAIISSTAAAVFGLGGGLILISFLPDFLSAEQIIPIHGVTQLASNASRFTLVYRSISWSLLPPFLIGSLLGSVVFTVVLVNISLTYIPLIIGIYILLKLWSKKTSTLLSSFDSFYLLGFLQTGLGIVVGSTGHLAFPRLMKELPGKDSVVATSALFMALSHSLKLLAYGIIGFRFLEYGGLLLLMISGAFIGSYIGTKLRGKLDQRRFATILKIVLTLLAFRMIFFSLI